MKDKIIQYKLPNELKYIDNDRDTACIYTCTSNNQLYDRYGLFTNKPVKYINGMYNCACVTL